VQSAAMRRLSVQMQDLPLSPPLLYLAIALAPTTQAPHDIMHTRAHTHTHREVGGGGEREREKERERETWISPTTFSPVAGS
jgi:hypothetical protein